LSPLVREVVPTEVGACTQVLTPRMRENREVSKPVIRVVLADDHPVVVAGLRALLGSLAGFEVVGEAADGESVVREVVVNRPDVVLMDVRMPGTDGLEATRRIRAAAPETAVLVLTMFDDDETVFAAMRAGAQGYLLKGAGQTELERALRGIVAGEAIFGPGVAARIQRHFAGGSSRPFPRLTDREREILDLIAGGLRNRAIADRLDLAPKTVANHISSIFAKLSVTDRSEAIVRAREQGLGRRE
jgi:DNA-binding NarL/FixJ family response regulator